MKETFMKQAIRNYVQNILGNGSRRFLIVAVTVAICAVVLIGGVLAAQRISRKVTTFTAPQDLSLFKPVVSTSVANGISPAVRTIPVSPPTARGFEDELPPVHPNHPVPSGFVDPATQTSAAALAAPAPNLTFEGMTQGEACGGCIPPDPNGAVGPSQYVQMVNSSFSVYSKSGTRLSGPVQINSLFQSLPATSRCRITNDGDPVVVYDQLADRWMLSQFAVSDDAGGITGPYDECIAISKGPDATGQYYLYDFPLSTTKFEDYPHFGLWPDGYYMSTHQFNQAGTAYLGAAVWAFERDKMLAGQPARLVSFDLGTLPAPFNTGFGGHLPSNLDGFTLPPAGAPDYFAQVDSSADVGLGNNLRIWKFHVDWTTPANSTFGVGGMPNTVTPVTDFARPNCTNYAAGCVPQAGDPFQLDPIGDRLMYRLAYRNFGDHEALVLNHTVVANATTGQMGPRWYEIRNPGGLAPTIFQQSTFGPSGPTDLYRWLGSIAMDRSGDIAIGYSTSSSATFPSLGYAGRLPGDTVNTLGQGEAQLFAGTGPQRAEAFAPSSGRWGDYSDLTVDPIDDCTFWYTNEYFAAVDAPTGAWHTRIGSFKFPSCTPRQTGLLTGTITDTANSNPIGGATVTAGGYTAISLGNGVYQFSPLAPGTYTATASAVGYFSSSVSVTITNGGNTVQNFALMRNIAEPTPTPTPPLPPSQLVNPPVLNDPGGTINTGSYNVTWSPAEVTTGLANYVIEESTNYVNPLFDNADGTNMPGQAGSLWNTSAAPDSWTENPTYHSSVPNSYFANGETGGVSVDTNITLKNNITIPTTVSSARLTFYSRYFNDGDDTGNVEVTTDNGAHWTALRVLNASTLTPPADTRVQGHEIDLTAYRGMPIKVRFRFNNGSLIYFLIRTVGWWVDDINVDGATWTQIGTVGPTTTSFPITNKPNGHYYYRVRAVYGNGTFTNNSNVQDIVVNAPVCVRSNVALASNSSTAVASSSHSSGSYPAASALTGDRTGNNWGNSGGWNDGTRGAFPDTLEVDFPVSESIDEIDVITLQNNWRTAGQPDLTTSCSGEGILDFDVQYWNGTTWVTVTNGSVTGNDKAWRKFSFTAVTTTKIRVVVNNSRNNWSRIVGVEAYGCPS